ncbi:hypothetical protein [Clostridium estertheticum]|uniref:PrgI family protein n=1 Tax=Clostridium estertheticum subsp. estertheticum TaxID=1552 RepID=A0A1J0GN98_9CLOT|nr:hypothetical protein [Clostridium estertheticum]APC42811.1 hypothetical protein A7L45_21980 [Clostridium estertheticum subsp. estertheticum]MCB2357102.1 hypothetical protein [Clostridium estertheticum]WAG44045.1 hypothetical protein LL065_26120 [Clostridium estertheticum]
MFIYPGNLKEKKTFMYLDVLELAIVGVLTVASILYSAENFTLIPLIIPITYLLLSLRILDNNSNLLEQLLKGFNYLLNVQQVFRWGERRK